LIIYLYIYFKEHFKQIINGITSSSTLIFLKIEFLISNSPLSSIYANDALLEEDDTVSIIPKMQYIYVIFEI